LLVIYNVVSPGFSIFQMRAPLLHAIRGFA
jgi:hypothetical protein